MKHTFQKLGIYGGSNIIFTYIVYKINHTMLLDMDQVYKKNH